jgi:glycosyltransferase involved in cell wall biosynthesis
MKHKVALIHNIISPYRVPLFEELAKQESLELFVYYCSIKDTNRKWDVINSDKYHYKVLPGLKLEFKDMVYNLNLTILLELATTKYDVIIISGCTDFTMQVAFLFSKIKNIPVILWSEATESAQSPLGKLMNHLTDAIIKKSDALIVPGSLSREFHIKRGANPGKIYIAPNIINNNWYINQSNKYRKQSPGIKKDFGLPYDRIILFVGQLIERKGAQYLLRAFKKLKEQTRIDACLIIIGEGPLKEKLLEICCKEEISDVYFPGWVSENEKIKYYSISDLFVLPTLMDLCPLVINEAMACGLPVITTEAAGCAIDQIVPGINGFLIKAADVNQLYHSMEKSLSDNISQTMGLNSLNRLKEYFNLPNAIEGFQSAIESAAPNESRAPRKRSI